MSNKQVMKNIIKKKMNDDVYNTIIERNEIKSRMSVSSILKYSTAVCAVVTLGVLLNKNFNTNDLEKNKNSIVINNIEGVGSLKIDARTENNDERLDVLKNIVLPKGVEETNSYKIFIKGDSNKYDKLNSYVYYYDKGEKSIRIALSNTSEPVRDYMYDDKGIESNINNINLIISKYENSYYTKFKYNNYNFDIETNNITENELLNVLKSIIK